LDCGQKFAYNHKTGRLVDFWGVRDTEALAGVRRRVNEFFSPLQRLAGSVGSLNVRIPISEFVKYVHRLVILTKDQWIKSQGLIASEWAPRSDLKETKIRPENN
jgi:hypothetical protein